MILGIISCVAVYLFVGCIAVVCILEGWTKKNLTNYEECGLIMIWPIVLVAELLVFFFKSFKGIYTGFKKIIKNG